MAETNQATVSAEEFAAGWKRLTTCFNIPPSLTEERMQGRCNEVWDVVQKYRAGSWIRAVEWYIKHPSDTWFPVPAQLFAALDESSPPRDLADLPISALTAEEKARLQRENAEFWQSDEVKEFEQKILNRPKS